MTRPPTPAAPAAAASPEPGPARPAAEERSSATTFVCIVAGPDHGVIFANPALVQMLDTDPHGAPLCAVLPQLTAFGLPAALDQARATGCAVRLGPLPVSVAPSPAHGATAGAEIVIEPLAGSTAGDGLLVLGLPATAGAGEPPAATASAGSNGRHPPTTAIERPPAAVSTFNGLRPPAEALLALPVAADDLPPTGDVQQRMSLHPLDQRIATWLDLLVDALQDPDLGDASQRGGHYARRFSGDAALAAERLREVLNTVPCGLIVRDAAGRAIDVNRAFAEILGLDREVLLARAAEQRPWALFRPDGTPLALDEYPAERVLRGHTAAREPLLQLRRPDGATRWVEVESVPVLDAAGAPVLIVSSMIDVTAREQAELSLRRRNRCLTALHETTLAILHSEDSEALVETLLERTAALFDAPRSYIALLQPGGETMLVVASTGIDAHLRGTAITRGIGAGGRVWASGQPIVVNDYATWTGRIGQRLPPLPAHVAAVPLTSGVEVIGLLSVAADEREQAFGDEDLALLEQFGRLSSLALENVRLHAAARREIAERRRVEAALREQEQRFHTMVHTAPVGIGRVGLDGRILDTNPALEEMLGCNAAELEGERAARFLPHDERARLAPLMRRLGAGEIAQVTTEARHLRADGSDVWLSFNSTLLRDEHGAPQSFITAAADVTERRRAERVLAVQNGYLAALHETTLALMNRLDLRDLLDTLVARAAALLGVPHGYIYLVEPDGETMRAAAGVGMFQGNREMRIGRGAGIGGHVWETGRPLAVDDYSAWEHRLPAGPRRDMMRATAAVPLRSRGQVVGVLALAFAEDGHRFGPEEMGVLEQFAQLASLAFDNAALYRDARMELEERRRAEQALLRQNRYLAALHETTLALTDQREMNRILPTIVSRACALLETDHAYLNLIEPDGTAMVTRFAAGVFTPWTNQGALLRGGGMSGRVWESGESLAVADYAAWPDRVAHPAYDGLHAMAAVPLKLGARVVGVLGLARAEAGHTFSPEEVDALSQFAQLAAVAVENGRLNEEARAAAIGLRRQLDFTNAIASNLGEGIMALDGEQRVTRINPAAEAMLGWVESELQGRPVWDVLTRDEACGRRVPASLAMLAELLRSGRPFRIDDAIFTRRDGVPLAVDYSASPIVSGEERLGAVIAFHDITERKQQTAAIEYQALHDALTGLPNRVLLQDRLDQAIRFATREGQPLALFVMDLNGFKEVNDTLGHQIGDLVLQQVALRLQGVLRESDTVARLGGDEFALLLPGVGTAGARHAARKLLHAVGQATPIDSYALDISASAGVALFPEHGADADGLLRRADVAMYVAKRARSGFAVYEPEQDKHTPDRLAMFSELRQAVEAKQFVLHYQPVARLSDGRVMRAEALARWRHPRHGLLQPDAFISVAEDTSLITPFTQWVLGEALRQCQEWREAGHDLGVAVNLSPRVLHEADLPRLLQMLLARHSIDPAAVTLEITECALITHPQRALDVLTRLHEMGLRLAIDDFGTGYSSLAYVKQLPIDEIKIDKSFVIDMRTGPSDAAIVRSTIDLARNLGLKTVAEGIEDADAWDRLAALGCDDGQGYFLTRPLPPAGFDAWLRARPTATLRRA